MTDDQNPKHLSGRAGYAAFVGMAMSLPQIARLLPEGTAFTATTAARVHCWMSVSPYPSEVYVAVPSAQMHRELRGLRFDGIEVIPVVTEGLGGEGAIEWCGNSLHRFPVVSQLIAFATLTKVAEANPEAMRAVLTAARTDLAKHAGKADRGDGPKAS